MTPASSSSAATAAMASMMVKASTSHRAQPIEKPVGLLTTWAITSNTARTDTAATTAVYGLVLGTRLTAASTAASAAAMTG